ncbi:hypothetical protein FHR97_002199 [Halomonas stenophila]|uniref:Uncharacterized protein n=1 Tax=Halomonas stenophila TaxID=795312 RepID=A0A7W5ETU3_9GAMM|nr:hypothetical protein [Halomonas stenophila]
MSGRAGREPIEAAAWASAQAVGGGYPRHTGWPMEGDQA